MKRIQAKTLLLSLLITGLLPLMAQDFEWVKQTGSPGSIVSGNKIITDNSGNVYTAGTFSGAVDFDPGPGISALNSGTINNAFICKLDSSGDFLWAEKLETPLNIMDMATDKNGNLLLLTAFTGTVDADPGSSTFTISGYYTATCIIKLSNAGNFIWAKAFSNTGWGSCNGKSIGIDSLQNIYISGNFRGGPFDFDPGAGTYMLSSSSTFVQSYPPLPVSNFFICQLDSGGNFKYAKKAYNGASGGYSSSDETGSAVVNTRGEAFSFYNETGYASGSTSYSYSYYAISFEKRNINGSVLWRTEISHSHVLGIAAVATDRNGNLLAVGSFSGTVDFDPGMSTYTLSSSGSTVASVFILLLDNQGNFYRAHQIDCNNNSIINLNQIITDAEGSMYICGSFKGTIDFDPNIWVVNTLYSAAGSGFILKLDRYGAFQWVKQIGENSRSAVNSICLDNFGNLYTTGSFTGTVDFDPGSAIYSLGAFGSQDAFAHKLSGPLVTGIAVKSYNTEVRVFPNPASSVVYLQSISNFDHGVCRVTDVNGKMVQEKYNINGNAFEMDLSLQAKGLYVLEISDAKTTTRIKLVKD